MLLLLLVMLILRWFSYGRYTLYRCAIALDQYIYMWLSRQELSYPRVNCNNIMSNTFYGKAVGLTTKLMSLNHMKIRTYKTK